MLHSFINYGQKIEKNKPIDKLFENLDRYCNLAKEQGATDVKMINCSEIVLDRRTQYKCQIPPCRNFGTSINCPPHTISVDEAGKLINLYRYAVLMVFECPSDRLVADAKTINNQDRREIIKAITAVESAAFYDGYYFAIGLGTGCCKSIWCSEHKSCNALEGNGCRFHAFARASMEAIGIDVFATVLNQGWDIYPIGRSCTPDQVPTGKRVGMVLID